MSAVLATLDARCALSTGLVAGGDWSLRVDAYEGLKFNALLAGSAWLRVEGCAPVRLGEGDCFLLAGGRAFTIASDLALAPIAAGLAFAGARDGVARIGQGEDLRIVAGRMSLDPALAPFLSGALPALTVLEAGSEQADSLQWLLRRIAREAGDGAPAGDIVADRLIEVAFIELLRAAGTAGEGRPGWLAALGDRRLARVLEAMHAEPARRWTLPALAAVAHMSRSAFAEAFRKAVGVPPLRYLQRWRLHAAAHGLRRGGLTVAAAAAVAGYASDSAFVSAFRALFGCTPARYAAAPAGGSMKT